MNNNNAPVPVGFRFHPTDEELVGYYLHGKVGRSQRDQLIQELDLYKIEPWDLQGKNRSESSVYYVWHQTRKHVLTCFVAPFQSIKIELMVCSSPGIAIRFHVHYVHGQVTPMWSSEVCRIGDDPPENQNDWYFFSHKDKKYPSGNRANRATTAGFWKATGRDKPIHTQRHVTGMRKTLVFYKGRAPHGQKTDWIMHEFRLDEGPGVTLNFVSTSLKIHLLLYVSTDLVFILRFEYFLQTFISFRIMWGCWLRLCSPSCAGIRWLGGVSSFPKSQEPKEPRDVVFLRGGSASAAGAHEPRKWQRRFQRSRRRGTLQPTSPPSL